MAKPARPNRPPNVAPTKQVVPTVAGPAKIIGLAKLVTVTIGPELFTLMLPLALEFVNDNIGPIVAAVAAE